MRKHLGNYISINKVPGKKDCLNCIGTDPEALRTRTWRDVKNYVHNTIMSKKRKRKRSRQMESESDKDDLSEAVAMEPATKRPRRKRRRRRRM